MIDLIYHNQVWFAGILFLISSLSNAVCDAIKFSSRKNHKGWDTVWHFAKYGFDRPALFFSGALSYNTLFDLIKLLCKDFFHYLWHLPADFTLLLGFIAISFLLKELVYRLMRKILDRTRLAI